MNMYLANFDYEQLFLPFIIEDRIGIVDCLLVWLNIINKIEIV